MRLIDADALKKTLKEHFLDEDDDVELIEIGAYWYHGAVLKKIDNAPTIAIKATAILLPPHAEWIEPISYDGLSAGYYICSKCRCIYGQASNYCPNCGAKMDEGGDAE